MTLIHRLLSTVRSLHPPLPLPPAFPLLRPFSSSISPFHPSPPSTPSTPSTPSNSTVSQDEVNRFSAMSDEWWTMNSKTGAPFGETRMLHRMNPVRMRYILDTLADSLLDSGSEAMSDITADSTATTKLSTDSTVDSTINSTTTIDPLTEKTNENPLKSVPKSTRKSMSKPLAGLRILDVGSGGGLLSESLARLGADVTGVDASLANVKVATQHANLDDRVKGKVKYICARVEDLASASGKSNQEVKYDVITALEILEHLPPPAIPLFLSSLHSLLTPTGTLILSTMNKTPLSYLLTITLAEHLLALVPKGTHDWNKYIPPPVLHSHLQAADFVVRDTQGIAFDPLNAEWILLPKSKSGMWDLACNYFCVARIDHSNENNKTHR